jgi:hypothetical protein
MQMTKLEVSNQERKAISPTNEVSCGLRGMPGSRIRLGDFAERGLKSLLALSLIATSLPVQAMTTGPSSQAQILSDLQVSAGTSGVDEDDSSSPLLTSADDYFREAEVELDDQGRQSLQNFANWADENADEFDAKMRELLLQEGYFDMGEDESSMATLPGEPEAFLNLVRRGGRSKCRPVPGRILMGCCLMYVRMLLDQRGLIPDGMRFGQAARDAGRGLLRTGFRNTLNPRGNLHAQALASPIGAVLVYTGGPYGHIELKTASGYYFGPTNAAPATSWTHIRRRLTGIYVK